MIVSSQIWWSELWCAKDNWIGWDVLKIEYHVIDNTQRKNSTELKQLPQSNVEVIASSETLSWWSALWCAKDNWIGRDILKIKNHPEYIHQIQWKAKQHMPSQWWMAALASPHFQICFSFFFWRKVLIQNPAHANNFIFPAMASPRQVVFLILVRIRLPAHERASGRCQSGGSHNSDSENWQ